MLHWLSGTLIESDLISHANFVHSLAGMSGFFFGMPMLILGIPYALFIALMLSVAKNKPEAWLKRVFPYLPILFSPLVALFTVVISDPFNINEVFAMIFFVMLFGYFYIFGGFIVWGIWGPKNDT